MTSKRITDSKGKLTKIVIESNGVYKSFTPKEAAQAINELKKQLWSGMTL